jgi:hypothetical protein
MFPCGGHASPRGFVREAIVWRIRAAPPPNGNSNFAADTTGWLRQKQEPKAAERVEGAIRVSRLSTVF